MNTRIAARHPSYVRRALTTAAAALALAMGACREDTASPTTQATTGGQLDVYVSIPPQKTLVEAILGDRGTVQVLLGPGQSPHSYEPTPKQMVRLASADILFSIGVPFEKQMVDRIHQAAPDLPVVDLSKGIPRLSTEETSEHGDDHDHGAHNELDPHIWMNPRYVMHMADIVADALASRDPAGRPAYEKRAGAFRAELAALDKEIATSLAPLRGRSFYVFHPAFGYFAEAYGLRQVAIQSGGRAPTARQLESLIERARREHVHLIFVQPQFSRRDAETVAEAIGGAVVPLDPLAEDYLSNLRHIAATIRVALAPTQSRAAEETTRVN
jgi:zinc transport system substrate-binding protein